MRKRPLTNMSDDDKNKMEVDKEGGSGEDDSQMDVVQEERDGADASREVKRQREENEELRRQIEEAKRDAQEKEALIQKKDEQAKRDAELIAKLTQAAASGTSHQHTYATMADILTNHFKDFEWPSPSNVKLVKVVIEPSNPYAKSIGKIVAAPNVPTLPSLMFHRIDKHKQGEDLLVNFPYVQNGDVTVLLYGPSGVGKTRKIFQFLWRKRGLFVPYKTSNDGKYGSEALSQVIKKIESSKIHEWNSTKREDDSEYEARRTFVHFGVACVLAAYSAIFNQWSKAARKKPTPSQWLLVQLFPGKFLGTDLFAKIACDLFDRHNPIEYGELKGMGSNTKGFPVVIDEAQIIAKMLVNGFQTRDPTRQSLRAMLGPVVSGVWQYSGQYPIISGTGVTLIEHKHVKEMVSSMAMPKKTDWICCEFTSFSPDDIKKLMKQCLGDDLPPKELHRVSLILQSRPRFTTATIEMLVSEKRPFNEAYDWILEYFTRKTPQALDVQDPPRTPYEAFVRIRQVAAASVVVVPSSSSSSSSSFMDNGITTTNANSSWKDVILETFLISAGFDATPSKNPALVEFGLGHATSVSVTSSSVVVNTEIKFEPLILEAGCNYRDDELRDQFEYELVKDVQDMHGAMGSRYEYPVALRLLPALFPANVAFESNPLTQGTSWSTAHPDGQHFCGIWQLKPRVNGCFAAQGDGDRFYDWVADVLPGWGHRRGSDLHDSGVGMFFPSEGTGPDVVAVACKSDQVMLIVIQIKLVDTLSAAQAKAARRTVDPSKFNMANRSDELVIPARAATTTTTTTAAVSVKKKAVNAPVKKYEDDQKEFIKCLKNVPVVRILVSGVADIVGGEPIAQLVPNHRGGKIAHDLMLNLGPAAMEQVLGNRLANLIRGLKVEEGT